MIFKNPRPAKTDSRYVSFRQSRYLYASTITFTCPDTYLELRVLTAAKKRGTVGKVERVEVCEGSGGEGSGGGKGEEREWRRESRTVVWWIEFRHCCRLLVERMIKEGRAVGDGE